MELPDDLLKEIGKVSWETWWRLRKTSKRIREILPEVELSPKFRHMGWLSLDTSSRPKLGFDRYHNRCLLATPKSMDATTLLPASVRHMNASVNVHIYKGGIQVRIIVSMYQSEHLRFTLDIGWFAYADGEHAFSFESSLWGCYRKEHLANPAQWHRYCHLDNELRITYKHRRSRKGRLVHHNRLPGARVPSPDAELRLRQLMNQAHSAILLGLGFRPFV